MTVPRVVISCILAILGCIVINKVLIAAAQVYDFKVNFIIALAFLISAAWGLLCATSVDYLFRRFKDDL